MPICKKCNNRIELKDSAPPNLIIFVDRYHGNIKVWEGCTQCYGEIQRFSLMKDTQNTLDSWKKSINLNKQGV